MGGCLSWYHKQKLTRPIVRNHPVAQTVQSNVLQFVFRELCERPPIEGIYSISFTGALAGYKCVNCGLFETLRDFSFRYGPYRCVQFQIPLCENCRLRSVVAHRIYNPSSTGFRDFYQLSIVVNLLEIHRFFVEQQKKIELVEVELMMVS